MTTNTDNPINEDDDLTPDPALVQRIAGHVASHFGTGHFGKYSFDEILQAVLADEALTAEMAALNDGARELLLDDVQTEIG